MNLKATKISKINSLTEIAKNNLIPIYFGILFILLSFVYFPSFSYPPRSDWWSTAYFFHRIDTLIDKPTKWLHFLQYDPWSDVRFQPLGYVILYFEKLIFGSSFLCFQIFNFILYYISILLLYRLAINFCKSKLLVAAFLTIFAFLFSHFDIICWSFHSYIIFGFCSLILGFTIYINFLKSGKSFLLFFVCVLFLTGMLCYETFILWPLGGIILSYIQDISGKQEVKKSKLDRPYLLVIGIVYSSYIIIFFLIRIFRVYINEWLLVSLAPLFSIQAIVFSILATFFNIIYNGLLINLVPLFACPLVTNENLNLGGLVKPLVKLPDYLNNIVLLVGSLFMGVLLWMISYLFRRKDFNALKVVLFFLFLLCSEFFILFHCRRLTNPTNFILTQFRYLYIPNAFAVLLILYLIDRFLNQSKKGKAITYSILAFILILNIYTTKRYGISVLNQQLAPLKKMVSNIKTGIKTGKITKENRLFVNNDIFKRLPSLCWNKSMGKYYMRGTYQWVFSDEEIKCFSSFKDAKWIVNEEDFNIVKKPEK